MQPNEYKKMISVIVPVYNVEKYLGECLDSILTQSYSNIEIICIDDKSTDSSGIICDQYVKRDSRIRVVHKGKNGGLSEARNTGMGLARGEYLAFIDSDDWVEPDYLECLYNGIEQNNAEIAQCGFAHSAGRAFRIHEDTKIYPNETINGKQALKRLYVTSSVKPSVAYTIVCNKLYKKEVLHDLKFPKGCIYEDQFFTYRCFERSKRISVTDKKLYNYRINANSITRQKYNIRFQDEIVAHSEQIQYFRKRDPLFSAIIVARMEALCILHYGLSEFEEDIQAKRNAYKYALKYSRLYWKNSMVCWNNKLKFLLFLLMPSLFIHNHFNIDFNAGDV